MEKSVSTTLIMAGGIIIATAFIQMSSSVKAEAHTMQNGVVQKLSNTMQTVPDANSTEFTYKFDDSTKTATVTGLKSSATQITIPERVASNGSTYDITSIDSGAFDGKGLTSVILPQSLITIESGAFAGNKLSTVVIPDKVETINAGAFTRNGMTSVQLGSSVKAIMSGAFADNQLSTLVLPNSLTTLEGGAFSQNKLTGVKVPSAVSHPEYAFDYGLKITTF